MLHNSSEENLNPSSSVSNLPSYQMRTVEDYLELIPVDVRQTMTDSQIEALMQVIMVAIPKPAPKLVDLRFDVDLLLTRLFVVLMIGRDRRKTARRYTITPNISSVKFRRY